MKPQLVSLALLAGLSAALPSFAQTNPIPVVSAPTGGTVAVTPDYKLAPGDVVGVSVADWPGNSTPSAAITPDGLVSMPMLGQIKLAGKTVPQATALLTTKWKKYIIDPMVTVSLLQKHSQTVVFSGSLVRPGAMEYRPGMRIVEALAEAGGAISTANAGGGVPIADPVHVSVAHDDGTKQVLNLSSPETLAGTDMDILLQPGDVVTIPPQFGKINVVGEVRQPGVIPYREHITVFDAISATGGYNADSADLAHATILHNGVSSPINLEPMLRSGDMAANVTLAPGDQISIPEIKYRTVVFGDVARPGAFVYKAGYRISDALSSVSGPTQQADLGKINIIRTDKIHGTQMVRVDFNKFVLRGDPAGNPLIQPGDSLYIPDKHHNLSAQDILAGLSGVSTLAYTNRALQGR